MPLKLAHSSYLFKLAFNHCVPLLQSLRLPHLSFELEGREATLQMEALQCMTIALAGSDAVGLRDVITTFYGNQQDSEKVWDYIDPKSKVARPLELEDTETEEEDEAEEG